MIKKFFDPIAGEGGGVLQMTPIPYTEFIEKPDSSPVEEKEDAGSKEVVAEEKKEDITAAVQDVVQKKDDVVVEKQAVEEVDWKEVVKKQDKKEVFSLFDIDEDSLSISSEIKGDDFVKKLLLYRKEHGNLAPFLEAATKDWDKVSKVDLIRHGLKKEHPNLSDEKFEILAKSRIDKKFLLGDFASDSESDMAEADVELEIESEKIRNSEKEAQKRFLDNVKPVDRGEVEKQKSIEAEVEAAKRLSDYHKLIEVAPETISLLKEKKITVGEGKDLMNYTIEKPEELIKVIKNPMSIFDLFVKDGKDDWNLFYSTIAFALDRKRYDSAVLSHGKSLGTQQISEEDLENKQQKIGGTGSSNRKESWSEAFSKAVPYKG